MPQLLIVHHTPSPSVHSMLGAIREGTEADELDEVTTTVRAALAATAVDVLEADGYVLLSPANLGSMAGAMKHFFDTIYYPCLEETRGRPWGLALHGNNDVDGALADIDKIVTGLGWQQATEHVKVIDRPGKDGLEACWNLGATVAATLLG